jgi:PAS domain S-box-containing protein
MFGTAQDVTRQVLIEQALRESEEKFSQAFQYNPLPMTISRFDTGQFIDVNRRFIEVFGFTREESIGKSAIELGVLSADDRARLVEQIIKKGRIINARFDFYTKNGPLKDGQVSYDIIMINGHKHLLAIFMDNALVEKS